MPGKLIPHIQFLIFMRTGAHTALPGFLSLCWFQLAACCTRASGAGEAGRALRPGRGGSKPRGSDLGIGEVWGECPCDDRVSSFDVAIDRIRRQPWYRFPLTEAARKMQIQLHTRATSMR